MGVELSQCGCISIVAEQAEVLDQLPVIILYEIVEFLQLDGEFGRGHQQAQEILGRCA